MPQILLDIFACQPDEKRIDAACLVGKYASNTGNKMIISHIVDQIWIQYDNDNSGHLDQMESRAFMRVVMELHESTITKLLNINPLEISE